MKEWLLGLESDGEMLGRGDKKIPKGCREFSGHSLDSFFTKSLQRYAYYNDTEGFPLVKAHLDKLKTEVDERQQVQTLTSFSSLSSIGSKADVIAGEDPEDGVVQSALSPRQDEILCLKAEVAELASKSDAKGAMISGGNCQLERRTWKAPRL